VDLTAPEIRVLGCLIEKQRTTPDAYPLTLNALRVACNQSTARDPVVRYDDATVRDAMTRLSRRRWARLAGGGRAPKFRHLLDEALTRASDELAVLCVLMLRGPQTPGELKQRSDRLHPFADLAAVHETLRRLVERDLVMQLGRRPGQKEERYAHRLGDDDDAQAGQAYVAPGYGAPPPAARAAPAPAPAGPAGRSRPHPEHGAAGASRPQAEHGDTGASHARSAPDAPGALLRHSEPGAPGALLRHAQPGAPGTPDPPAATAPAAPMAAPAPAPAAATGASYTRAEPGAPAVDRALQQRVERLEADVAELRAELRALLDELA
jgi:uncharacterized protein YceH (UPF0502 family)